MPHGGGHVAQHHPKSDGDPRGVRMYTVVLPLWEKVDVVVPGRKQREGDCRQEWFCDNLLLVADAVTT